MQLLWSLCACEGQREDEKFLTQRKAWSLQVQLQEFSYHLGGTWEFAALLFNHLGLQPLRLGELISAT